MLYGTKNRRIHKGYMESGRNTMKVIDKPAFGEPAMGISHGDDELYGFYKQHIDPQFYKFTGWRVDGDLRPSFDAKNVSNKLDSYSTEGTQRDLTVNRQIVQPWNGR